MGRILLRHQWTQQPPASQPLDYGNPLLKGLRALFHAPRGLGNAYSAPGPPGQSSGYTKWGLQSGAYGIGAGRDGFAQNVAGGIKSSFNINPVTQAPWSLLVKARAPASVSGL